MGRNLNKCLVDQTEHANIEAVHTHLRKFRIKQSDYYSTFYPRKDLLTGESIDFKSIDQYFAAHFKDKINMKRWYKEKPEEAKILSIQMLKERIERKKLQKLPGEIELISAGLPSSQYYYRSIVDEVIKAGFELPYNYKYDKLDFEPVKSIVVDTREQQSLKFKGVETVSHGLTFGDYAIPGKENQFCIERKSLPDFISSFVTQYDRIKREFERAKEAGAYLVVLCEESLNTALSFPYIPYFRKYTKVRPEIVFHNVRNLIQEFGFQFIFCDGRVKAAEVTLKLLGMKQDIRTVDLQWAHSRAEIL